ncbi:amino acid permease [Paraphaeosphaeria sporulosa]|uniref:Amino acid permease n=1 Tax=Paraphaeosphaeria sporulosa TaxID=1460663 RepID=A0A177CP09_9PLEO|nr:amino acid permease [Paraphaeosphaeria sporulosa]OAG08497.1 amino acid permease [Paraphaeosphaeria sporulosa]
MKESEKAPECEATSLPFPNPKNGTVEDVPNHGEFRRSFTPRQIHVLSLGGQIGAGLFISTGTNLLNGGPGSLVLGFIVVCTCVWGMLQTVSEISIAFPVSGNFIEYADRFVDPALSFAAGLSMWLGWTAIVAAEATFFSVIVNYWAQNRVHDAVWYTVFLLVMMIMFMLPSVWFGWFEYCAAILKIIALLIFVFAGFAMVLGAGPKGYLHHGDGWKEDPFKNGFKGFASSVLLAVLAIGDNSFTGFLAGEAKSPRYSVGHAAFLIPIRVTTIYLVCIIFISILVSADSPSLYGSSGVAASPFVIALNEAGITGLPDFLNCVILVAVASIGAESIFIASRMLRFMSHQNLIPQWVAQVDSKGRPRWAIAITLVAAIALTYCNLSAGGIEVFTWLAQIASTGYFMVWVVVAIISFRFRAALNAQNDPLFKEPYAWKCTLWPMPPILLLTCCSLYTACSFYLGLYPISATSPSAYSFFQYMIGLLLIVFSGIGYKIVFRTKLRNPAKVDLHTGRRTLTEEEIFALDAYYSQSKAKRFYSFVQLW